MDPKTILTTAEHATVNTKELPNEAIYSLDADKSEPCANGVCMVTWKPSRNAA